MITEMTVLLFDEGITSRQSTDYATCRLRQINSGSVNTLNLPLDPKDDQRMFIYILLEEELSQLLER